MTCDAFTKALYVVDTTVDTTPGAPYSRAIRYTTPALRHPVNGTAPGARWEQWAAHHVQTQVTVSHDGDDHPPDQVAAADRGAIATVVPVGRDGWHGSVERHVVFCQLTRTAGSPWLVAHYTLT